MEDELLKESVVAVCHVRCYTSFSDEQMAGRMAVAATLRARMCLSVYPMLSECFPRMVIVGYGLLLHRQAELDGMSACLLGHAEECAAV